MFETQTNILLLAFAAVIFIWLIVIKVLEKVQNRSQIQDSKYANSAAKNRPFSL
jgi:hypothetical protein